MEEVCIKCDPDGLELEERIVELKKRLGGNVVVSKHLRTVICAACSPENSAKLAKFIRDYKANN